MGPHHFNPTAPRLRDFPGGRALDRSNPVIYMGSIAGVKKCRARRGAIVCPLDIDPLAFRWPVEGLSVAVIGDDGREDAAERLNLALIRDRAKLVVLVFAPSGNTLYRTTENDTETR